MIKYTLPKECSSAKGVDLLRKILLILTVLIVLAQAPSSWASGTVTGTITTPSTSIPINNGVLTFSLNQSGIDVSQSYALASTPFSCYTDSLGAVKRLPDALVPPLFSINTATGSLASGTYYIRVAYFFYDSVSMAYTQGKASPEVSVVLGSTGSITVNPPTLQPAGATGFAVYMSTSSNNEKLQGRVTGWSSFTQSTALATVTAYPTSNNTVCTFTFNDSIIPTSTRYRASLTDVNGRAVGGWPKVYYFAGSTVDLATYPPVSTTGQVQFPMPILANPLSQYATQSINSNLTLNNFYGTMGAIVLPENTLNPPSPQSGKTIIYTDGTGTAKISQDGNSFVDLLGIGGGWVVNGTDVVESTPSNSVLVGWSSHDLTSESGGPLSSALVGRNYIFATNNGDGSGDDATNTQVIGIGVDDTNGTAWIASGVSGTETAALPIGIRFCFSSTNACTSVTSDFARFKVPASSMGKTLFVAGPTAANTDASVTQVTIVADESGVGAVSAKTDAILSRLWADSNFGYLEVDKTGTASYKPLILRTNNTNQVELTASGDLFPVTDDNNNLGNVPNRWKNAYFSSFVLVGDSLTDATLTSPSFVTVGDGTGLYIAGAMTDATSLSLSVTNGAQVTIESGRSSGSGSYQPLVMKAAGSDVYKAEISGTDRTCIYINGSLRLLSISAGAVVDGGACP